MSYPRYIAKSLEEALTDNPVTLINGSRQVGKSTLLEAFAESLEGHITLDDVTNLTAAISAPASFIENLPLKIAIDEIQRAPELFLPIKKRVDQTKRAARFLLTGSANVLMLPKLAESLAGRMEIYTLWPLSQGEINHKQEGFIDAVFADKLTYRKLPSFSWEELATAITTGGYPEILARTHTQRREQWYNGYINSLLQRDIRDLAQIENMFIFPTLLNLLAARVGGLVNYADLARLSQSPTTTLKRYITLLEALFLIIKLPPWFNNHEKKLVKSPKFYLNDTGLLCYLLGINAKQLSTDRHKAAFILENFILMELMKQSSWSVTKPTLYHFRTQTGHEVDFVLQARDGRLVGIEVKTTSSVNMDDFKGLKFLQEYTGKKFQRGIVLYCGTEMVAYGKDLYAIPIHALWELASKKAFNIFTDRK